MTNALLPIAAEQFLMRNYGPRAVTMARGAGARLWDDQGREYLDFLGGLGVNNLGHCHPAIIAAIRAQSEQLLHCCNLYLIENQLQLAETLCAHSFADRAFFCNSGTEAVEAALKICRLHAWKSGRREQTGFIAFERSFHGRTFGALSVTAPLKAREGFEPALPNVRFARFNDLEHTRALLDDTICAIIVEPVIGEGGVIPARPEFLSGLRRLCDAAQIPLVFDEVQCGLGRCGTNFAYQQYQVEPDILTLAKGLAGGLPIGATLAREPFASAFEMGQHGSTFGGNPLCCAAALAYCRELFENGLAQRARETGEYLRGVLASVLNGVNGVKEIRGLGLMLGIELDRAAAPVADAARERGLLVNATAQTVIRLLPPLIVSRPECDRAAEILAGCIAAVTVG